MNKNVKHTINDYFEIILYVLALICFIYYFAIGIDRSKLKEPILVVTILISLRLVINKTNIDIFPILKFSYLCFIFIAMFLGVEFGFYSKFIYWDKFEHLLSGIILCFTGFTIFKYINRDTDIQISTFAVTLFSLFFAVAMAGSWEIFEFTSDHLLGTFSQKGSLMDTMTDIICGTTGATATSIYLNYKLKTQALGFSLKSNLSLNASEQNNQDSTISKKAS